MDVYKYLHQGTQWMSGRGFVKIADMSPDHASLAAQTLTRHATALISIVECAKNEDIRDGFATLADVMELVAQNPQTWVKGTPLYQALMNASQRR